MNMNKEVLQSERVSLNPPTMAFTTRLTESDDEFRHTHDFFECFYVTEGEITHDCDGKKERLSVGDAALVCPDAYHSFKRNGACIHRDFLLSKRLVRETCDFLDDRLYDEISKKRVLRFNLQPDEVLSFEHRIADFLSHYDVRMRHIQEKLLAAGLLDHIFFSQKSGKSASNDFRTKSVFVINTCFARSDAMQEITNELGFEQSYLCKKFKSVFNMTLTEYINALKIKHAAYLLQTTDYTQQKICESIGIESLSYFNKLFKQKYGITPAKFKRHVVPSPLFKDE